MTPWQVLPAVALGAVGAALAEGCGGASNAPSVASLGTTATSTMPTTTESAVQGFAANPDTMQGTDPRTPVFKAAYDVCRSLYPRVGPKDQGRAVTRLHAGNSHRGPAVTAGALFLVAAAHDKELISMRSRYILIAAAVLAGVALVAAGCGGGGGKSPGVASVASSTTTTTAATPPPSSSPAGGKALGGPSGGRFQIGMRVGNAADGAKFSACMRKHGVTNFPDPNGQGVITIHSGMGIDPGSPAFTSARTACEKLLPNGGQPTPAQMAQQQKQLLAYSACMRAHGVKDFPDPSNGGLQIRVSPGSDLDPNNPTFQKAQQACQKNLPLGGKGG